MAHLVETMAYTNEVPWHGLGTRIDKAPTVDKMIKLAGLDWTVDRQPMFVDGVEVPGFAALQRSSDKKILDVVGSHYKPVQNADAFKFFTEFVEAGGATMETAGSLRGGKLVWGLADLKASFKMKGDDRVKGYLLVASPHEQGKSLIIRFTTVRVVCNNTLTLALGKAGQEWRMNHRSTFDDMTISKAKDTLGIARDQLGEFERNAKTLQKLNLKEKDIIKILAPVYQPDVELKDLLSDFDKHANSKMKSVMGALEHAPGAQPDNGWGVLNAVTYYSDHIASRTADKRLTNAWLGRTAQQKEVVLSKLLQAAS